MRSKRVSRNARKKYVRRIAVGYILGCLPFGIIGISQLSLSTYAMAGSETNGSLITCSAAFIFPQTAHGIANQANIAASNAARLSSEAKELLVKCQDPKNDSKALYNLVALIQRDAHEARKSASDASGAAGQLSGDLAHAQLDIDTHETANVRSNALAHLTGTQSPPDQASLQAAQRIYRYVSDAYRQAKASADGANTYAAAIEQLASSAANVAQSKEDQEKKDQEKKEQEKKAADEAAKAKEAPTGQSPVADSGNADAAKDSTTGQSTVTDPGNTDATKGSPAQQPTPMDSGNHDTLNSNTTSPASNDGKS